MLCTANQSQPLALFWLKCVPCSTHAVWVWVNKDLVPMYGSQLAGLHHPTAIVHLQWVSTWRERERETCVILHSSTFSLHCSSRLC